MIRLQDWRDARFADRPLRATLTILPPMAALALLASVASDVLILPSAWLLVLAAAALLGGWRIGIAMTLIGAVVLGMIVTETNAALHRPFSRTILAVAQFLLAGGGVSLAVGGMDRAIREMRTATRALAVSENRAIQVARNLQHAILPAAHPEIPGLRVAARYLPADTSEVGGDFYDWYQAEDGSWYLQIGDVCGKGPAAASRAMLARYTLRTAAMLEGDPIRMLRALNTAILDTGDDRYCTALVLRFHVNVADAAAEVDAVLGGHPQALVLRGDQVAPFGRIGSLLGLFPDINLQRDHLHLNPGDRLFLYTDGVTDHRIAPMDDAGLHALLRDLNPLPLEAFASELERRLLNVPGVRDDIAFFVIAVDEEPAVVDGRPSDDEPAVPTTVLPARPRRPTATGAWPSLATEVATSGRSSSAPAGRRLQLLDPLRGLRLGQRRIERLPGLLTECLQVRRLRSGHRLVTGDPVFGVPLWIRLHPVRAHDRVSLSTPTNARSIPKRGDTHAPMTHSCADLRNPSTAP